MSMACGYKKTSLGWLPEEWGILTGEDISTLITKGSSPNWQGFEYSGQGVLFVTSENVRDGFLDISTPKYLPIEFNYKQKSSILKTGDLLINIVGASIGRSCIYSSNEIANINQAVCLIRIKLDIVYPAFVLNFLNLTSTLNLFTSAQSDSARPNLTLADIRNFKFIVPPLPEQIKIAQILSSWDKAITQTQQLIEAKQRLKQGLMQQLLTGRMRFKEYLQSTYIKSTRFYSYPSDWAHPKIQEFAKEVSERNEDGDALTVLSCSKYSGFVNSLEYFGKQVFSDDTSNYKVIYRHQFGFPANHIEEGSIGLLKHVDKGMVSPIYIIFDVDKTKVNPDYLYLILKSETYKHIFRSRTSASVDRRGSLRWDEFSDIRVPIPSLSEQARIVSLFESCAEVIAGFEFKKEVLIKQKQGLMQKLLTGQIRVKVEA